MRATLSPASGRRDQGGPIPAVECALIAANAATFRAALAEHAPDSGAGATVARRTDDPGSTDNGAVPACRMPTFLTNTNRGRGQKPRTVESGWLFEHVGEEVGVLSTG